MGKETENGGGKVKTVKKTVRNAEPYGTYFEKEIEVQYDSEKREEYLVDSKTRWYPVPGHKMPGASQMVLLWAPTCHAGYGGIVYGWLGVDGKWYHHTAIGSSEILEWAGRGSYYSPVQAWAPMPTGLLG